MSLGENGLGVWKRFSDKPKHRSRPAAMKDSLANGASATDSELMGGS